MNYLDIRPDIQQAIQEKKPVVALESTIISHGMPFPKNVETALRVEAEVRKYGAIPATIGIINGRLKAGLTPAEIELMGKAGTSVSKVSRRDLPLIIAQKKHGATTVAATMIIAQLAGIQVFATGGIGGVHRGAAQSMDISADLEELAKTNVAVVSAGVKSILDIGLTLEYLETKGVPVITYQSDEFPAFYTRKSGHPATYRLDTPSEIAAMLRAKWELNLEGGVIIANPIPEIFEMENDSINMAINDALKAAEKANITGKSITPFLLAKVEELTKGKSLASNIELVLNNARLASLIAVDLSNMKENGSLTNPII